MNELEEKLLDILGKYGEWYASDGDPHHEMDGEKAINALLSTLSVYMEELEQYVHHDIQCIRDQWSAGRPTKDGGYEQKFAGKWYQARPVDKTPKCDCGLDDILSQLKEIK